jgi:hypothetical protein
MPRFWPVGLLVYLASGLLAFFGSSSGRLRASSVIPYFRLSGLLVCLASGLLACLASGLLAFWHASLLAYLPSGMPRFWPAGLLACLASGLLAFWPVGLLACLASSLLAFFGPPSHLASDTLGFSLMPTILSVLFVLHFSAFFGFPPF